jgi:hypothetical protein
VYVGDQEFGAIKFGLALEREKGLRGLLDRGMFELMRGDLDDDALGTDFPVRRGYRVEAMRTEWAMALSRCESRRDVGSLNFLTPLAEIGRVE